MMRWLLLFFAGFFFPSVVFGADEPGLLFYLSGDHGFRADYAAGGKPEPNFLYAALDEGRVCAFL